MRKSILLTVALLAGVLMSIAQVNFSALQPLSVRSSYEFTASYWEGWGADLLNPQNSINGQVQVIRDGTIADSLGCEPTQNVQQIAGKIAMIYRGNCNFSKKALEAQNAGAIGVIIVNNVSDPLFNMGEGDYGYLVNIPVIFVSMQTGALLRPHADAGTLTVYLGVTAEFLQPNASTVWQTGSTVNVQIKNNSVNNIFVNHINAYSHGMILHQFPVSASFPPGNSTIPINLSNYYFNTNLYTLGLNYNENSNTAEISSSEFVITEVNHNIPHIYTPISSTNWYTNETSQISWFSYGITGVKIEYSTNNGSTWSVIENNFPVSGNGFFNYDWDTNIPGLTPGSTYSSKIRLSSASNNSVNRQSETFNITKTLTATPLGSSANVYTLFKSNANVIAANQTLNTVSFIHRNNPNLLGGNSSQYMYDISKNGGSTWQLNLGPFNPSTDNSTILGRYPQIAIFNPTSNTISDNGYNVYLGSYLSNNSWEGTITGVGRINGNSSTFTETTAIRNGGNVEIASSLVNGAPGIFWSVDLEETTKDIVIYKGTWNGTNNVNWVLHQKLILQYDLSYNGNPQVSANSLNIAFDPSGLKGWIALSADIEPGGDEALSPVFFKTTDGGNSWQGPFSLNLLNFENIREGTNNNGYPLACATFEGDLIVDNNGNPHFAIVVGPLSGSYSIESNAGLYLYDFTFSTSQNNWFANRISLISKFSGFYHNNRPQLSTTSSGDRIFYVWNDTDPSVNWNNSSPNVFGLGFNTANNTATSVFNFTNNVQGFRNNAPFVSTATQALRSGTISTVPTVIAELTASDTDPANFYYLSNVQFNDNQFSSALISSPYIPYTAININNPSSATYWTVGNSVGEISFTTYNVSVIKLEYSVNNGQTWQLIEDNYQISNGFQLYPWNLNSLGLSTGVYNSKIRITDLNSSVVAISPTFTIEKLLEAIPLGSSANLLTVLANNTNVIAANQQINTISFIHRNNPVLFGGNSGQYKYDISKNGGSVWQTNIGPFNQSTDNINIRGRFPQIAIFNQGTNSIPDNAYNVYMGTYHTPPVDSWEGTITGVGRINGNSSTFTANTIIRNNGDVDIAASLVSGAPGVFWAVDTEESTGQIIIYKGTWNGSDNVNWAIHNKLDPGYNGSPSFASNTLNIAFDPTGVKGWIAIAADIEPGGEEVYTPVFFKTIDSGNSWQGPESLNLSYFENIMSGISNQFPAATFEADLVVDNTGQPHYFIGIGAVGDSPYTISLFQPKYLYNFTFSNASNKWFAQRISEINNLRGYFGGATADNRPQLSTSSSGDRVFFLWNDSDPLYFTDNSSPNVFGLAMNSTNGLVTTKSNFTQNLQNRNNNSPFLSISPTSLKNGNVHTVPAIITELTGTYEDPVNFHYLPNIQFNDNTFTDNLITSPYTPPGVLTANFTSNKSFACISEQVTFTNASTGNITSYNWNFGSGANPATAVGPGPHTVSYSTLGDKTVSLIVSDGLSSNSETKTNFISVITSPAQPVSISGNTSVCSGNVQTYSVSPVAGAASYTWTLPSGWSGSSTTNSITTTVGNTEGNISVVAVNNCGTSTARTLAVSVSSTPSTPGLITGGSTVCSGTSQTYSVAAITGATSYNWTLPSGWTGTSATNSITATAVLSGNISVTASNSCGTGNAQTLNVTVNSTPLQPGTISGLATVCENTQNLYSVNAVQGATSYTWTLPSGWSGTSVTESINATAGLTGGNISVVASNNCGSGPARTLSVNVNNVPAQPGLISGNTAVCQGSTNSYSISAVSNAASYVWTLPSGWSGSSTSNTINATSNNISGPVSVAGVNACGTGAVRNLNVIVNQADQVSVSITATATTICAGDPVTFTATPTNGGNTPHYQWKLNGNNIGDNSATYTNSNLQNNNVVTVVMTSSQSCIIGSPATSDEIIINVSSGVTPQVTISEDQNPACVGSPITFTASYTGAGANPTFQWKVNNGNVGDNIATFTSSALSDGNEVYVVMTSASSCTSGTVVNSNKINVSLVSSVLSSVTISPNNNPACANSNVVFTAVPSYGGASPSFQWRINGDPVGGSSNTFSTNSLASGNVVSCIMTSSLACVTNSPVTSEPVPMTITPTVTAAVTISTMQNSACAGNLVTFTANPENGGDNPSYQWKLNGGNIGANSPSYSSNSLTTGDVILCVMTSNATCAVGSPTGSNSIIMNIKQAPPQPGNISGALTMCENTSQVYSVLSVSGADSYTWNLPNGWTGTSTSNIITVNTGLNGGNISVTANNNCGSSIAQTVSATVTNLPAQPSNIIGSAAVCEGTLNTYSISPVSGGVNYNWTIPAGWTGSSNTSSINVTASNTGGVISVLAMNSCGNSSPQTLAVNSSSYLPASVTISGNTTACQGEMASFNATPINGGNSPMYQWKVNNNNVGGDSPTYAANNFMNGDVVSCIMTSNANCVTGSPALSNNSLTISLNSQPAKPTITANGNILASSPANSYQWNLNGVAIGGANSQFYSAVLPGFYTVTISDNNGCSNSSEPYNLLDIGISDLNSQFSVSVYPNPTLRKVNIQAENLVGVSKLSIRNIYGQTIFSEEITADPLKVEVDLQHYPPGVYQLTIENNHHHIIRKIVKGS
jgi:hypothetical protein